MKSFQLALLLQIGFLITEGVAEESGISKESPLEEHQSSDQKSIVHDEAYTIS